MTPACIAAVLLVLSTASGAAPAPAQPPGGLTWVAGRGPALGTNVAPRPGLYSVVRVDLKARRIRLRDADGKTIDADVAAGAYDLAKLKTGDRVRVDFVAQEAAGQRPTAATIWPEP